MDSIFDQTLDRRQSHSIKWQRYAHTDIIPAWIADMDFRVAPPIVAALNNITQHAVFGYSTAPDELYEVIMARLQARHNWRIERDWIVWLPGVVPGLGLSVHAATTPNQSVMTALPVYHHFMLQIEAAGRQLQKVYFVEKNNRWTFDFEAIEAAITPETKLFLLCNPLNPGGTVFEKDELLTLAHICLKHNIVICSDEIHCDLVLDPSCQHHSVASFSEEIAQASITLMAPSKTFNIADLGGSFAVIPNKELRDKFVRARAGLVPNLSSYAIAAMLASYRDCGDWHSDLLQYLKANHDFLLKEINSIKGMKMLPLEATYLAWVDATGTGLQNIGTSLEAVGVGISPGSGFGREGFFRLNFACPRATLEQIVQRIKMAV